MLHTSIFSSQRASGFEVTILSWARNGSGVSGSGEDFTTTYLHNISELNFQLTGVNLGFLGGVWRRIDDGMPMDPHFQDKVRPYASQVQFPALPVHLERLHFPFLDRAYESHIADSHYTHLQRLLLDEFLAKYGIYTFMGNPCAVYTLQAQYVTHLVHQSTNEHEREKSSLDLFLFQGQDAVSMRPIGVDPVIEVHLEENATSEAPLPPQPAIVHKHTMCRVPLKGNLTKVHSKCRGLS
ncbi:hypothetical protein BGX38DRAFT_1206210 [Terfezia claveryi]|nr:hypothetical protein BGX38DRAFT_1206210 [Terfezia claveryi]